MTGFSALSHAQLAAVVPELLLCGHLIDRSGMPHTIGAFGREGMTAVAITEWQLASPVYTRRMRTALGITGDGVETIFKGLQLDIGAPPQFMDFRYRVDDHDHGEFWLDHCGALADVEPLGDEFVKAMCHDIEDPTFDATALATNPHAQVRPIHRPPRVPANRTPVCAWSVVIDPSHTPPPHPQDEDIVAASMAAHITVPNIDATQPGLADYTGPLLSDLRFSDFSHSALVRIAQEVCLQHHLLTLAFRIAVGRRLAPGPAADLVRKQFAGIAGITAERLRAALGLGDDLDALAAVLALHPAFNPREYVRASIDRTDDAVRLRLAPDSPAITDGAWPALLDADHLAPLQTLAHGVNSRFTVQSTPDGVEFTLGDITHPEAVEVALTRISTGASFAFTDRTPLPLTVMGA